MDDFIEYTARRRGQGLYTVLYILCWAVLAIFGVLAVISLGGIVRVNVESGTLLFNWRALVFFIVFGGIAFLCFRLKDHCRVEYDYAFTNGTLDVSRVMNNLRRKYLCSVETRSVISCGPAAGPAFQKALSGQDRKVHNWFVNRDAALYYFYFEKKGARHVIVLELTDEFVAVVRSKNYLQKGVWYEADGQQRYGTGIS